MQTIIINATSRDREDKKSAAKARKEGMIPAVVYGGETNILFSTTSAEVKHLIYTPDFKLAQINLNGESYPCILKDMQLHPVTDEIVHLDFLRLIEGTKVSVDIPVKLKGDSPGVKSGGTLIQSLRKVTVKATPEHLMEEVYVDISLLELGNAVRVRDLEIGDEVEVLSIPNTPIAAVVVPRVLIDATATEEGLLDTDEEQEESTEQEEA